MSETMGRLSLSIAPCSGAHASTPCIWDGHLYLLSSTPCIGVGYLFSGISHLLDLELWLSSDVLPTALLLFPSASDAGRGGVAPEANSVCIAVIGTWAAWSLVLLAPSVAVSTKPPPRSPLLPHCCCCALGHASAIGSMPSSSCLTYSRTRTSIC